MTTEKVVAAWGPPAVVQRFRDGAVQYWCFGCDWSHFCDVSDRRFPSPDDIFQSRALFANGVVVNWQIQRSSRVRLACVSISSQGDRLRWDCEGSGCFLLSDVFGEVLSTHPYRTSAAGSSADINRGEPRGRLWSGTDQSRSTAYRPWRLSERRSWRPGYAQCGHSTSMDSLRADL